MAMQALTNGRLAEAAGVNLETVRYYERIGLMPSPDRTTGGHRAYEPEHVRRLTFIRRVRDLGFGIGDIRALLALAEPELLRRGLEERAGRISTMCGRRSPTFRSSSASWPTRWPIAPSNPRRLVASSTCWEPATVAQERWLKPVSLRE
jgi:DNA-binding transcriptional MerR regulator